MQNDKEKIKIIIIGAGKAGALISRGLRKQKDTNLKVIGFVDDDEKKAKKKVEDLPVLGKIKDIKEIIRKNNVQEVLIAIPSGRGEIIRQIILNCCGLKINFKILPRISEVLLQTFDQDYIRYIRKVHPEDILGGEIVKSQQKELKSFCKDKTILITGAAGSIGSELSKQLTAYGAKKIIYFDWWENGMCELQYYIKEQYPNQKGEFIIGDIKDKRKVNTLLKCFKPDTIFHAAAYKHVPIMESNASEAIKNNIIGTKNMAELAIKHKVSRFVLISTDKAVNPTNIMGATKRAAEKIIHIFSGSQKITNFYAVRFGNVVNSYGSAIPLFLRQIERGGPITVTHPEINRYFMTISEAVHLILQAWVIGKNNDLFVLNMGEPIKIKDLVKILIILNGYIPEKEIPIKIIGLRPGEKLFEELLVKEEEVISTTKDKIFKTKNYMNFDKLSFLSNFSILCDFLEDGISSTNEIKKMLKKMVSTYKPDESKTKCSY